MGKIVTIDTTPTEYVKNNPYVDDKGIYFPIHEYTQKGTGTLYRCVLTKELFVEAYNKWIKEE